MPAAPLNTSPQWSADGFNQWSADGFYGWTADGYQPTLLAAAVTNLAVFGVNVGLLNFAFDPVVPLGFVITGYVPFLSSQYAGQYIQLTVSNGPAPPARTRFVPNVVGLYYYDAQLLILRSGLLTAQPTFVLSSIINPQFVISQSIPEGTAVNEQTQVSIVVSGFPVTNQPGVIIGVP
jgi:beta-lactam-binding protein with PASTA domain